MYDQAVQPQIAATVVDNLLTTRSKLRDMILSESGKTSTGNRGETLGRRPGLRGQTAPTDRQHFGQHTRNINALSSEMCMSRASFFHKIKLLTGVTPNNFILIYRLNWAAEMIRSRDYRLNEVADLLGFSSQSHSRAASNSISVLRRKITRRGGLTSRRG